MTTHAELRTTLEEAFKTGWGVTTPIAWDNIVENIPDIESPWVRVTIKSRRSSNIVIGEGEPSQLNGFFSVQIFVPMGDGLGAAWAFVDSVNAVCAPFEIRPQPCNRCSVPVIIIWIAMQIKRNPMIRVIAFIPLTPSIRSNNPE